MSKYKNLTIIGTSHIARESVEKVRKEIQKDQYSIVAVELDQPRLKALFSKSKPNLLLTLKELGLKGLFFNLFGAYIEKKLGKYTGIKPGSEMKEAIILAKKNNIKVALIDQPIQITIKKLTSQITRKEKFRFIKEIFIAFFSKKKKIEFDLNKIPSEKIIQKLIKKTKKDYPTVYKILIHERNRFMAKNLNHLILEYPDKGILAVVGAGHEKAIIGEIKSLKK